MNEQYKIIEYPLIILFIVLGSLFLISTSDLVSIFLSIELQSYGFIIYLFIYFLFNYFLIIYLFLYFIQIIITFL